jgi:hypothetical protein
MVISSTRILGLGLLWACLGMVGNGHIVRPDWLRCHTNASERVHGALGECVGCEIGVDPSQSVRRSVLTTMRPRSNRDYLEVVHDCQPGSAVDNRVSLGSVMNRVDILMLPLIATLES